MLKELVKLSKRRVRSLLLEILKTEQLPEKVVRIRELRSP